MRVVGWKRANFNVGKFAFGIDNGVTCLAELNKTQSNHAIKQWTETGRSDHYLPGIRASNLRTGRLPQDRIRCVMTVPFEGNQFDFRTSLPVPKQSRQTELANRRRNSTFIGKQEETCFDSQDIDRGKTGRWKPGGQQIPQPVSSRLIYQYLKSCVTRVTEAPDQTR